MEKKGIYIAILLAALMHQGFGQSWSLTGKLFDDQAVPLAFGTVVLLHPADSTMEFFGISNTEGRFEIRNIRAGEYLMQASFMGFRTFYHPISIPRAEGPDVGDIILQTLPVNLQGAEVVGEAVPLQISGDTVVYNAAAFKTRPDAMTEELLKKLPGVEVDRAGNIKALGEDVNTVYVDGKEFFGSDPTVATRNIPADAIDKVKVYDKKSDETEFTGIDDGSRNKTLNLELKEDRKNGIFGDMLAGYGSSQGYKASGKVYRFSEKIQIAALGMINNVNEYGFSFSDYMNFNGGGAVMMKGEGSARISLGGDNAFPVNFGQAIDGLATTGAGGFNFSYSTDKHNRTYISYLLNGSDRDLEQESLTEHYTGDGSFLIADEIKQRSRNLTHSMNFGLRRRIDSTHNIIFDGSLGMTIKNLSRLQETANWTGDQLVSSQLSRRGEESDRIGGDLRGTYYSMIGKNRSVLKFSAEASYSKALDQIRIQNQTDYISDNDQQLFSQFQDNSTDRLSTSLRAAYTQKIGKGIYLDPSLRFGGSREQLDRLQGSLENGMVPVDSISPAFQKVYRWIRPGFNIRWNKKKSQLSVGITGEFGNMDNSLNDGAYPQTGLKYFIPSLSWDYAAASGRKFNFYYSSSVYTPTVTQLLPVVNMLNPLNIYYGNPELGPEYSHSAMFHWLIFDQFSFTSFMMALGGGYTRDKINWATSVTEDLVQVSTLTNVDRDYNSRLSTDFSTPIRKLGIKINLNAEGSWNRGLNLVNNRVNKYHSLNQRYSLSADNRRKKRWDVESGLGATLTHTWYDIQESLDKRYFDLNWFTDLRYTPNNNWHFEITADITSYSDLGTSSVLRVPLLRAEVDYFFLAHNRGVITLSGFDLLDRNQNVQRISELNYLRETRSNTMGRYVMLSFKYRLNKQAREGGIHVELNKRR